MILRIAGAILTVVAFNMVAMGVLAALPPPAGLAWVIVIGSAFYAWSVRPGPSRRQRLARLRLRRPAADPRWIILCCAATIALLLGVGSFIGIIAPEMDTADIPEWYVMLQPYRESRIGWAALAGLIAIAIPLVEELSFRGHIQRRLERRYGVTAAIVVTAVLFMSLHVGGPHWSILGISLTLGLACGLAVHRFRSIWPAVLTHCAWNAAMLGAEGLGSDAAAPWPDPGLAAQATTGIVLLGAGLLGWRHVIRVTTPARASGAAMSPTVGPVAP